MGDPLTDFERGTGSKGLLPPYFDQKRVGYEISGILRANDDTERKNAYEAAFNGNDLLTNLGARTWSSDRKRRLYAKYFLFAYWVLYGYGEPTEDQLYFELMKVEKRYFDLLVKRREAEAATLARARDAAALTAARGQLQARAAAFAMNPQTDFEPQRYEVLLTTARRDLRWVDDDIVAYRARIDKTTGAQGLVLTYKDGATLDIPLHPVTVMYKKPLPADAMMRPFFRRHKGSGRLMPFQLGDGDFKKLGAANLTIDEVLNTVPPRFDPDLTPQILRIQNIVNLDWLALQFGVAQQGFSALSMGTGVTALKPANILVGGIDDAAAITANVAKTTATAVRTVAQEIHATVVTFGASRAAAAYLGKTAWSWYCRHAVAVNTATIIGAEIALTLTGNDAGPNSADDVIFAARLGKDSHKVFRMDVESVDVVPKVGKVLRGKVTAVHTTTPQKFADQFDSGKLIHHDPAAVAKPATVVDPKLAAKKPAVVDDATHRATTARAVDDPATTARVGKPKVDDSKVAAKKKVKVDPPPAKPPVVATKKTPRIDDPHGMRKDPNDFDRQTAGAGGIDSIAFLKDPDGRYAVKIKGKLQTNTLHRGSGKPPAGKIKAPNYNRSGKFVSNKEAGLDANWENAHLWGPGFGDEAAAGMMKAPKRVNQWYQNEGAEGWMRDLYKSAHAKGGSVDVEATAIAWDLTGKKWQPKMQVDFLKRAEYRVTLNMPGKPPQPIRITIECDTPPSAKAVITIDPPTAALPSNLF